MKKYLKIFVLIFALCFIVNVNCVSVYATSSPDYDKISKQLADDVKKHHIPGMAVMVVDKDSVLFQETYGNCNSIDTPFIIGSMSKSFTAVAIMQLVEENKIDLNKPVSEYINATEWFVDSSDCEIIKPVGLKRFKHLVIWKAQIHTANTYMQMLITVCWD